MFKPPLNIHRRILHPLVCVTAFGCVPEIPDCMEGYARAQNGQCQPIANESSARFNTPPTAPSLAILPASPRPLGTDLVCIIQTPSIDTDGDPVAYTVSWTQNGTAVQADATTQRTADTIAAERLIEGDKWTCTVIPSDGEEAGPVADSTVTVGAEPSLWEVDTLVMTDADYTLTGESSGKSAGSMLASAGDVDGDGLMDFVVGDTWWNHEATGAMAGKAYVVLGSQLTGQHSLSLSDAAWSIEGEQGALSDDPDCSTSSEEVVTRCGGDWAGHSASGGMDADGDGVPDLLISAYRSDDRGVNRGKFGFFSGANLGPHGAKPFGSASLQIHGEVNGDKLGHSVKWAGDVDGDGLSEALTGSAYHSANDARAGRAYLLPASTFAASGSTDINELDAVAWDGEAPEDRLGQLTEPLGDIDGDGLADFSLTSLRSQANGVGVGELEFRGSGIIYVVLGADAAQMELGSLQSVADAHSAWMGEIGGDAAGAGSMLGDFDGDGLSDMGVGAYGHSNGGREAGKIYIVPSAQLEQAGRHSLVDAAYSFSGHSDHAWAGKSLAAAGDIDRDGRGDVVTGAMGFEPNGAELAGRTYLVLSSTATEGAHTLDDADYIFDGAAAWDSAGSAVLGPGDINGDGLPDLVFGAWQGDAADGANGRIYVFLNP